MPRRASSLGQHSALALTPCLLTFLWDNIPFRSCGPICQWAAPVCCNTWYRCLLWPGEQLSPQVLETGGCWAGGTHPLVTKSVLGLQQASGLQAGMGWLLLQLSCDQVPDWSSQNVFPSW